MSHLEIMQALENGFKGSLELEDVLWITFYQLYCSILINILTQ